MDQETSSTAFLHTLFKLSREASSQGSPRTMDQPSSTRGTPRRLLPPLERTSTSTTSSVKFPLPSPLAPYIILIDSYDLSLIGRKTLQNFSSVEDGGGGVR